VKLEQVSHIMHEILAVCCFTTGGITGSCILFDSLSDHSQTTSFNQIAGALHGALVSGALATTYTASQGLLLYIPNLYKIAGELLPTVIHVASRALAGEALSIYGDHSDTMLVRGCGLAMLSSFSVQEAHDMAVISQIATLNSRVPFLHFMDGFRTSHEVNKTELVSDEQLMDLLPFDKIEEHRQRAMSPMHPS
jgi:pyruvate-ferredoxin/flavodoxin oxidoreductase